MENLLLITALIVISASFGSSVSNLLNGKFDRYTVFGSTIDLILLLLVAYHVYERTL